MPMEYLMSTSQTLIGVLILDSLGLGEDQHIPMSFCLDSYLEFQIHEPGWHGVIVQWLPIFTHFF